MGVNRQAKITIETVQVHKSESYGVWGTGVGGEAGSSAEWNLEFNVEGQSSGLLRFDGTRDGSTLTINRSFIVNINPDREFIRIFVSGVEIDDSSADDALPTAEYKIEPPTNWGPGDTFDFSPISHPDFSYTVTFRIDLVENSGIYNSDGTITHALSCTEVVQQKNWRWCSKCMTLHFAGGETLGVCPAGGQHDTGGSADYLLEQNASDAYHKDLWRWCVKCNSLFYSGGDSMGVCPADGHGHNGVLSGNYGLIICKKAPHAPGQRRWFWCGKCAGLHYAGGKELGVCPAGGRHTVVEGSQGYILTNAAIKYQRDWHWCKKCRGVFYAKRNLGVCPSGGEHEMVNSTHLGLTASPEAAGQKNWRWCKKCQGLFYAGRSKGICPSGGEHDHTGSGDYCIDHTDEAPNLEDTWRWCSKCQGMYLRKAISGTSKEQRCPAGGQHDGSGSDRYLLPELLD